MTIKEKLLQNCKNCHNGCAGCNTGEIFLDLCEVVESIEYLKAIKDCTTEKFNAVADNIINQIGVEQTMTEITERRQNDN